MFTVNLSEKLKRLTFKISVVFLASLFVVVLGPNLLELEGSQALAKKKKKGGRYCSKTAQAVYKSCLNEIADDYWIAYGNCINVLDSEKREDCFNDAKKSEDGYKAAKEECKDQFEARRELCEDVGEDRYDPEINPGDFVDPANIGDSVTPNPYFPLVPGYKWTYKGYEEEGGDPIETIVVEVLDGETITIAGVKCVVVRDIVYDGDSEDEEDIIEDTYDWYGQKDDGTVWYFGEFSLSKEECEPEELCEGLYSEDGSWKHGYDGGRAGILMFADPSEEVGTVYRQEVSYGNAEDAAEVLSFGEVSVSVTAGDFSTNVLQTLDFTPIEPDATEFKYYARGVGVIKEEALEDDEPTGEFVELVSFEEPTP
jgi:hypothetical protein